MTSSMMPTIERAEGSHPSLIASDQYPRDAAAVIGTAEQLFEFLSATCDNQFAQEEGRLRSERAGQRVRRSASPLHHTKAQVQGQRAKSAGGTIAGTEIQGFSLRDPGVKQRSKLVCAHLPAY
jgi:hypothetical protein